jgi:hypothetical protein
LWSSSLCNFLHDPSSSLLGPNILLNTLFSQTLSLCSSLKVRDQVSHPYSTNGRMDPQEEWGIVNGFTWIFRLKFRGINASILY